MVVKYMMVMIAMVLRRMVVTLNARTLSHVHIEATKVDVYRVIPACRGLDIPSPNSPASPYCPVLLVFSPLVIVVHPRISITSFSIAPNLE